MKKGDLRKSRDEDLRADSLVVSKQLEDGRAITLEYSDEKRDFTFTAVGDLLITRQLSPYTEQAYLDLWDIVRSASVRFANLETLLHGHDGYPAGRSGGTYTQTDPGIVEDLKWAGFNILARANNHATDYTFGGILKTTEILDQAGLCHAGVGVNLSDARSARYLDLAEGRIALLSATTTLPPFTYAGQQRHDTGGRPGPNPLRFTTTYLVDQESMDRLREIGEAVGLEEAKRYRVAVGIQKPDGPDEYTLDGTRFALGDSPGVTTEVHPGDSEGNLRWTKDARRQADFVVYSIHWHEGTRDRFRPADFHQPFARASIDAGADVVVGHGPHFLRGMEIYKGRPIFYSLGNFVFQNETVQKQPAEFYEQYGLDMGATPGEAYDARTQADTRGFPSDPVFWESVVPWCRFEKGELVQCKLYPVTLGFGKARTVRGRPLLASSKVGERIIGRISDLSRPFGTEIYFQEGVGIVKL